jgi:hypothetical protein
MSFAHFIVYKWDFLWYNLVYPMKFKILRKGKKEPVFVGDREVAERCFAALQDSFNFESSRRVNAEVGEFPFSFEPA